LLAFFVGKKGEVKVNKDF